MRNALKCASIYAGCGSLARGLVESGHELCCLVESEEKPRDVLRAGFMGVEIHKSEETLRSLPTDTELLAASLLTDSKAEFGFRLAQVIRLAKSHQHLVPWIFIELRPDALETKRVSENPSEHGHPAIAGVYKALEQLQYSVAHRVVDLRGWGMPCMSARVLIVASRDGDPREVLLAQRGTTVSGHVSGGQTCDQADVLLEFGTHCKAACYSCCLTANKPGQPVGIDLATGDWAIGLVPPLSPQNVGKVCFVGPQGSAHKAQAARLSPEYAEFLHGLPEGWTMMSEQSSREQSEESQDDPDTPSAAVEATLRADVTRPETAAKTGEERLRMISNSLPVQFSAWAGERLLSLYLPGEPHQYIRNGSLERRLSEHSASWPIAGYSIGNRRMAVNGMGVFPIPCKYLPLEQHEAFGDDEPEDDGVSGDVYEWINEALPKRPDRKAFPEEIVISFAGSKSKTLLEQPVPLSLGEVGFAFLSDEPSDALRQWPALILDPKARNERRYIPQFVRTAAAPNGDIESDGSADDDNDNFLQELTSSGTKAIMLLGSTDVPARARWAHTGYSQFLPYFPLRAIMELQGHSRSGHQALENALREADLRFKAADTGQRSKSALTASTTITSRSIPSDIAGGRGSPLASMASLFSPCRECMGCKCEQPAPPNHTPPSVIIPSGIASTSSASAAENNAGSTTPFTAPANRPLCLMAAVQAAAMQGNDGAKITVRRGDAIGAKISVHWPQEDRWFQGTLNHYDPFTTMYNVKYDDGEEEETFLWSRHVRIICMEPALPEGALRRSKRQLQSRRLKYQRS